ncbi:MAG TPA: DUF2628 domain-containing protein [Magnetovibrio sp.]
MMSIYSVHIRDSGSKPAMVVIPDGFSWGAAVFGFLWALYIGAWDLALLLLVIQVASETLISLLLADPAVQGVAQLGVAVAIGFSAQELRRMLLGLRGLREAGVVTGADRESAERRYFDTHPTITARLLGMAS